MSKIRVGVVGVGHLGYHHARIYGDMETTTLVGVADVTDAHRERAAHDFSTRGFDSVEALLAAGVDAVSVATPTSSHSEITNTLLQAGVHVLVEKPIAASLSEAQKMLATAQAHQCILQVGHIERFNGAVMALLNAFEKPRFIECHRLSPFPGRGTDVSVVLDLMIHDLDVLLAMEHSEVISIDAVGVPVFSSSEDIANVRLRFASGCVANLTSSRVSMDRMRKIRIFAQNAYVSTDYGAQEVLVYRKKTAAQANIENVMEQIAVEPLPVQKEEPLRLELASFVNCVRTGSQPVVTGEDGVKALKLAQDIVDFIREHS